MTYHDVNAVADADAFHRSYLFVDVPGPATNSAVADLLEAAGAALRRHGELDIHHLAFDLTDQSPTATISLTVYYDRVERRRRSREK